MKQSKIIMCILISVCVIGIGISVLWALTKPESVHSLEGWTGKTVDIISTIQGSNYYSVRLLSVAKGNPSGVIIEDKGVKMFIYHYKIVSIRLK